jgi:hypothetical protein
MNMYFHKDAWLRKDSPIMGIMRRANAIPNTRLNNTRKAEMAK